MPRTFQLWFLPFLAACSVWAADKPNIIVFLVDDMGLMDTSVPFLTNDAGEAGVPMKGILQWGMFLRHVGMALT